MNRCFKHPSLRPVQTYVKRSKFKSRKKPYEYFSFVENEKEIKTNISTGILLLMHSGPLAGTATICYLFRVVQ